MTLAAEGVLFIATGQRYLNEAIDAAAASRRYIDDRPIAVVTDETDQASASGAFEYVSAHPSPHHSYRDKIIPLIRPPFRKTLFLDSDARAIGSIDSIFTSSHHAHIAAAHAPVRRPAGWLDWEVPDLFPEFNSGVLMLRRSRRQRLLIKRWLRLYDEVAQSWDQASLRSVLWREQKRGLRLAVLPPEANLRLPKPWIAGRGLQVSIVHGRLPTKDWPKLITYLNKDVDRFRTSEEWNQLCAQPTP